MNRNPVHEIFQLKNLKMPYILRADQEMMLMMWRQRTHQKCEENEMTITEVQIGA